MAKLKVIEKEDEKVPVEVMATAIRDIAEGVRKLRQGPLNDKALLLLIQHASPTKGYGGGRHGISEIKAVLDGIESLDKTYLKKAKG